MLYVLPLIFLDKMVDCVFLQAAKYVERGDRRLVL